MRRTIGVVSMIWIALVASSFAWNYHAASPAGVVTLSLGVATLAAEASLSNEDLIRRADRALYRAKALGRNLVEAFEESREPV